MNRRVGLGGVVRILPIAVAGALVLAVARAQEGRWPVEPSDKAHTIGNTLEPFWSASETQWRVHSGVDIIARPFIDDKGYRTKEPTMVLAVADGTVEDSETTRSDRQNYLKIRGNDGKLYVYYHLAPTALLAKLAVKGASVAAGDPIGAVDRWVSCPHFHHLHFERRDASGNVEDPLDDFVPRGDTRGPEILDVRVLHVGSKTAASVGGGPPDATCARLEGPAEVRARVSDEGDEGDRGRYWVGIRRLRLERRRSGSSDFETLHTLELAEAATESLVGASRAERIAVTDGNTDEKTTGNYCVGKQLWYRITDGTESPEILSPGSLGVGTHAIRITAEDFAAHADSREFYVCVPDEDGNCGGAWSLRETDGGSLSWVDPGGSGVSTLKVCLASVGCGPANLRGPFDVRFEWEACEGPSCEDVDEPWQVESTTADEPTSVQPGGIRCFDVAWDDGHSQALEGITSGRIVVRVAPAGAPFGEGHPEDDRRTATIEVKPLLD